MKINGVKELIASSEQAAVMVLKHSAVCGLSAKAKTEVDAFMSETNRDVYLVVVQEDRPISNALAEMLKVQHESPQLLVIDKGKVSVLNHRSITKDKITSLLAQ